MKLRQILVKTSIPILLLSTVYVLSDTHEIGKPTITYADSIKDTDIIKASDFNNSAWWKEELTKQLKKPFTTITYGDLKTITSVNAYSQYVTTYVKEEIPIGIQYMTNLEELNLSKQDQTIGKIPDIFQNNNKLQSIEIGGKLTGNIPTSLLENKPDLTRLVLSGNGLVGTLPTGIQESKNLEMISVTYTGLSGEVEHLFEDLPKLAIVYLGNNQFTGKLPIINSENLQYYHLNNTKFEGEIPESLAGSSLKGLLLQNSPNIYGSIPEGMVTANTNSLNVSQTSLSGLVTPSILQVMKTKSGNISSTFMYSTNTQTINIPTNLFEKTFTNKNNNKKFIASKPYVKKDKYRLNDVAELFETSVAAGVPTTVKVPFPKGLKVTIVDSKGNTILSTTRPDENPELDLAKLGMVKETEIPIYVNVNTTGITTSDSSLATSSVNVMPELYYSMLDTNVLAGSLNISFKDKDTYSDFGVIDLNNQNKELSSVLPSIVIKDSRGTHTGYEVQLAINHLTSNANTLNDDIFTITTNTSSSTTDYGGTVAGMAIDKVISKIPTSIYTASKNNGQGLHNLDSVLQEIKLQVNPTELRVLADNSNQYMTQSTLSIVPNL